MIWAGFLWQTSRCVQSVARAVSQFMEWSRVSLSSKNKAVWTMDCEVKVLCIYHPIILAMWGVPACKGHTAYAFPRRVNSISQRNIYNHLPVLVPNDPLKHTHSVVIMKTIDLRSQLPFADSSIGPCLMLFDSIKWSQKQFWNRVVVLCNKKNMDLSVYKTNSTKWVSYLSVKTTGFSCNLAHDCTVRQHV